MKIKLSADNVADYYTLFVLVIAIPVVVAFMTAIHWGLLLSFVVQATIGILYIKGGDK